MLIVAAALLTTSINVEIDLGGLLKRARNTQLKEPSVTCHISTVGYRFVGTPGQQFRYAGETWTVPGEGSIELIAHPRRTSYTIGGRSLPLEVWPRDQFGFREVPLPSPEIQKEN